MHKYYPSSLIYTGSKIYDYPSVGQLKKVFQEQKIQPVFAVTEDVYPLYEVSDVITLWERLVDKVFGLDIVAFKNFDLPL